MVLTRHAAGAAERRGSRGLITVDAEGRVTHVPRHVTSALARRQSDSPVKQARSQSFASIKFFSELDSTIHDQVTLRSMNPKLIRVLGVS